MNAFKKPLSQEEERKYLIKAMQGDMEARNLLVVHNMRLVAHVAKKYHNYEKEMEDLISVGTIGLIKAINTFKMESSNRLVTYASKCIENEILMMLRCKKKCAKDVSMYESIGNDREGNEIHLVDIIYDANTDIDTEVCIKADKQKLYDVLEKMEPSREKYILICRYGLYGKKEMTQREIADMLGISRSYVSRIEKKAIEYMRKEFDK